MNDLELELLNFLIEHGDIKPQELAKKLNKTPQAIYAALKKLRQKKILKGIYPSIDLGKLGYDFTAFIQIKADKKFLPELIKKHSAQKDIIAIYEISGDYDLLLVSRMKSTKELYILVKELTDDAKIESVNTNIAYKTFKEGMNPFPLKME